MAQLSAEQMLQALSSPMPAAVVTRGISARPRPDASTNLCEEVTLAAGNKRSLYVVEAPAIDLNIAFEHNSAALSIEGRRILDTLAKVLQSPELRQERFVVAGHTNRLGSEDYNLRLSCARAIAAKNYLRDKYAISPERLIAMGFGFERLKDSNSPEAEANRRVEIRKSVH